MKKLFVKTDSSYNVLIGSSLIQQAGQLVRETESLSKCKKTAIITDDNVDKLYANKLESSLSKSGYDVFKYVLNHGEQSKNFLNLYKLLEFLSLNSFNRNDAVIALGGGVVGDIAGLCAALYMRGIGLVQIPTSLLACVDSSVGGKTAVNLPQGKNLIGAFYQPKLVICDTDALKTLPEDNFFEGCAEIIKYAMIQDNGLLDFLLDNTVIENEEYIIEKCLSVKAQIVCDDEKDRGQRMLLNFGHTPGHAVEKLSDYQIPHGRAVAIGMMLMARGAYRCSLTSYCAENELRTLLEKNNLEYACPYKASDLWDVILYDKKRECENINIVVPKSKGKSEILNISLSQLKDILKAGLEV